MPVDHQQPPAFIGMESVCSTISVADPKRVQLIIRCPGLPDFPAMSFDRKVIEMYPGQFTGFEVDAPADPKTPDPALRLLDESKPGLK